MTPHSAPSVLLTGAVTALQLALLVLGAPLTVGLMRKVRCRLEGRPGPPVRQPLKDLRKLVGKERIRPQYASWIFSSAPVVLVGSALTIGAIGPFVSTYPFLGASADLFVFVFLFLVGSVALGLAGLDAGTAFGGMGASRAMTIGALAEPALLVAVLAISIPARSPNLPAIVVGSLAHPIWLASPGRLLALAALVIVVLAEAGRLPVDNPTTHLELTMIHEAMVLEYAGPDLALVKLGEAMRLGLLLGLLANLFLPWGVAQTQTPGGVVLGVVALVGKVGLIAAAIAAAEVFMAKLRLFRVPELLAGAFVLSVLGVVSALALA